MVKNLFCVRSVILILAVCHLVFTAWAQDVKELDKRNGFKDIKLGSVIDSYPNLIFEQQIEGDEVPGAELYLNVEGSYPSIGEVPVDQVAVYVYKKKIYGISVKTPKSDNLLRALKRAYGQPKKKLGSTSFEWVAENLSLVYRSFSKSQVELYYNSILMKAEIKADKDKKIDEIANDF